MQQYARFVAHVLTGELGIHVVTDTEKQDDDAAESETDRIARIFLWHARHTGCNYEDLGGILFLELAASGYEGKTIISRRLHDVLSRIRMRALRDARKAAKIAEAALLKASDRPQGSSPEFNLSLTIADLRERLDPLSLLIATALLEGRAKSAIATDLGMSRATFYRHYGELRRQLSPFLGGRSEEDTNKRVE